MVLLWKAYPPDFYHEFMRWFVFLYNLCKFCKDTLSMKFLWLWFFVLLKGYFHIHTLHEYDLMLKVFSHIIIPRLMACSHKMNLSQRTIWWHKSRGNYLRPSYECHVRRNPIYLSWIWDHNYKVITHVLLWGVGGDYPLYICILRQWKMWLPISLSIDHGGKYL